MVVAVAVAVVVAISGSALMVAVDNAAVFTFCFVAFVAFVIFLNVDATTAVAFVVECFAGTANDATFPFNNDVGAAFGEVVRVDVFFTVVGAVVLEVVVVFLAAVGTVVSEVAAVIVVFFAVNTPPAFAFDARLAVELPGAKPWTFP